MKFLKSYSSVIAHAFLTILLTTYIIDPVYPIRTSTEMTELLLLKKLDKKLEIFTTPTPEVIDGLITKMQEGCQGNFEVTLENMTSCVNGLFNMDVMAEIRKAIPKRNTVDLRLVFRDLCSKWPKMEECMKEVLETVGECGSEISRDQLLQGLTVAHQFFCGSKHDGDRTTCTGLICFLNQLNSYNFTH